MGLLDLIFPKFCVNCKKPGDYICPDCFAFLSFDTKSICLVCNRPSFNGLTHPGCLSRYAIDGSFTAITYNGIAKKLIYNFKYDPYLTDLQNYLIDLFCESLIQQEEFSNILQKSSPNLIFVPIPLSSSKFRKRGYNQAEILANGLAKRLDIRAWSLLERVIDTKSQVGLKREERIENIKNAFKISNNYQFSCEAGSGSARQISNFQYKTIFLVDDVLTSGSTFLEAARILKRNGAQKIYGLALAKD